MSDENDGSLDKACDEVLANLDDLEKTGGFPGSFPWDRAALFDALSKRIFPVRPGLSLKASRACILLATGLDDRQRLFQAHLWHGYVCLYSGLAGEARSDAERALGLLSEAGIEIDKGIPCSSPLKDVFLLSSRVETDEGFRAEKAGLNDVAGDHYRKALTALLKLEPDNKESDVWYLVMLGDAYGCAGEQENAVASYERALRYQGTPALPDPRRILSSLGGTCRAMGKYDEAERYYCLAAEAARAAGDDEAEGIVYQSLASMYFTSLNALDKARAHAGLAIAKAKDPLNKAVGLQLKGGIDLAAGFYRDALRSFDEAAALTDRAGDATGCAFILSSKASILSMMGKPEEALEAHKKALAAYDQHGLVAASIKTLCEIAQCHDSLGDYGSALETLDAARDSAARIKDHSLEANCLALKGDIFLYHIHSLPEAYRCFNEALLQFFEPYGASDRHTKVRALTGLGATFLALDDPDNAILNEESAIAECAGDPSLAPTAASLDMDLASLLIGAGRSEEARKCIGDALGTYEKLGMRRNLADAYRDSAMLFDRLGDEGEALRRCDGAVAMYREAGVSGEAVLPLQIAALVLFKSGRVGEAREKLETSLAVGKEEQVDPALQATSCMGLGGVCEKAGDMRQALSCFVTAIDILDSVRSSLATGDLKIDFQGQERNLYSAAVRAFHATGDAGKAFEYAEKAKSRVLLDQLRMTPLARPAAVDSGTWAGEDALIDELNATIRAGGPGDRMRSLGLELDGVWRAMERGTPSSPELMEYLSLRRGDSVNVRDLLSLLDARGDSTILEYYLLREKLLVFMLSPAGGLEVFSADAGFDDLKSETSVLLDRLESRSTDIAPLLASMGSRLLGPVTDAIKGYGHVHIVPHGFLHGLPFHALSLDGRTLLDDHSVSYSPSGTILKYCAARPPVRPGNALVVGDTLADLPFAGLEARRIARVLGCEASVGQEAAKSLVMSRIGESSIVSFSCHAMFDGRNALASSIILPAGERLTARELFRTRMPPSLVTMSACSSGKSEERPGDEMIGLVRSLLFAGARSIGASLWHVDDLASYLTMTRFYEAYRVEKMGAAKALRAAQLGVRDLTIDDLLRSGESAAERDQIRDALGPAADDPVARPFSHPYFWSPFVLIGDWK